MTSISTHTPREGRDSMLDENLDAVIKFQLTRPARGATTVYDVFLGKILISTHTPREGRDSLLIRRRLTLQHISTHTPREGRDLVSRFCITRQQISTHTPREGRDGFAGEYLPAREISTHTPREGRDFSTI